MHLLCWAIERGRWCFSQLSYMLGPSGQTQATGLPHAAVVNQRKYSLMRL